MGFHGPCAGSAHDFMVKGDVRVTIPNMHQGKDIGILASGAGPKRGRDRKSRLAPSSLRLRRLHSFADGGRFYRVASIPR
jgi:hypothetical protein